MKKIAKFLMVALLVIVATIAVSAVEVDMSLVDKGDDLYYLQVKASADMYVNVLDVKFTYDTDAFDLYSLEYEETLAVSDIPEYHAEAVEMVKSGRNAFALAYSNAVVSGDKVTMQITTNAPDGKLTVFPKEDFVVFNVALFAKADVTALTEDDFAIVHMFMDTWDGADGGAKYGFGDWSEPVAAQIEFVNNVVPEAVEPTKLTIAVAAGDVVYLQDGTVVEIAEANEAYEIPTTAGTVVVNSGFAGQKVYTVADNKVTEDTAKANGVLSTGEASIRDDSTASGIRFKSTFLTALKSEVAEYGYITTVESAYNALPADYVLDMDLVASGKAVKDIAYNGETDIFWDVVDDKTVVTAVVTGVPMTKEGVTTNVVIRPYYKLGELVVYGEPMTRTVYEVALNIMENDAETYAKYQTYIDEIISLLAEEDKDVVIDFGPLFK